MKKQYNAPKFESIENMQRYCDIDLNVSSDKLGDLAGGGYEDFADE